jgi:hypothetical protein
MSQSGLWSSYGGSSSLILAAGLLIVVGIVVFWARRLPHPIAARRPGRFVGMVLVVAWVLAVVTLLVAARAYGLALHQQKGHVTAPANPITPVTVIAGGVAFFAIWILAGTYGSGFWVAVESAIVGAIAAPMIFELPFDLIVMGRTYPPNPAILFTLLFFLPLFLVEVLSFAMLTVSPLLNLSRYTLFLLAAMFLTFAVWALFGFAYPAAPIPIALNAISKILAFATAVSLFLPWERIAGNTHVAQDAAEPPPPAPYASGLT